MKMIRFLRVALFLLCAAALLPCSPPAAAQTSPRKFLSAASNNSTLVFAGRAMLQGLLVVNTTTTVYYLKFYNKATAPTCGSDTPLWTIPIPYGASNSGSGVALPVGGLQFPLGLGLCIVGGLADNDNSNAAVGVVVNLGVSGY